MPPEPPEPVLSPPLPPLLLTPEVFAPVEPPVPPLPSVAEADTVMMPFVPSVPVACEEDELHASAVTQIAPVEISLVQWVKPRQTMMFPRRPRPERPSMLHGEGQNRAVSTPSRAVYPGSEL